MINQLGGLRKPRSNFSGLSASQRREARLVARREWYAKNAAHENKKCRQWRLNNRDKCVASRRRSKAKTRATQIESRQLMKEKSCASCGAVKLIKMFALTTQTTDGFAKNCRTCSSDIAASIKSKKCARCKRLKKVRKFGRHAGMSDGLQKDCLECCSRRGRDWYRINPEAAKENAQRSFENHYSTLSGRATHMLNNARQRARRLGVCCMLTHKWILEKLKTGKCEVTGLEFVTLRNSGKGHVKNSFSPSLDRIKRNGDYSKENVQIVIWIYNRAKGAFPEADLLAMCKALSHKHRSV